MHPMLFEYWWRDEPARIQKRAEMAASMREAKLGEAGLGSSRAVRVLETVSSGWPRAARASAGALAFGQRVWGRLSAPMPATTSGKRG